MGRVTLEQNLRETKTGAIVRTHFYTHDELVDGKQVSAVAAALDRDVQRSVAEISASLDQYFTKQNIVNSAAR